MILVKATEFSIFQVLLGRKSVFQAESRSKLSANRRSLQEGEISLPATGLKQGVSFFLEEKLAELTLPICTY